MTYRVRVNKDLCISSGKCVSDEPAAFAFDDQELAEVLPGVRQVSDEDLLQIARNCPSRAIEIWDEHGKRVELN